jgi:DNA-binding NtrC family response regulator
MNETMLRRSIDARLMDAVVLCVDDDELVLEVTQAILKRNSYSVLAATNGRHALKIFGENAVDLVLLDYDMPGMKGHEVALEMKSLNPLVPLILHSGAADIPEVAIKVTDGFISKGCDTAVLLSAVEELILKTRASAARNETHRARNSAS